MPACRPGQSVDVVLSVRPPAIGGSAVAYWNLVAADRIDSAVSSPPVAVTLVVRGPTG